MRGQRGITLLELIVTISIIAAIATVAATVLRGARAQARVAECASNLGQLGVLLQGYAQDNCYSLPEGNDRDPDRLPEATADLFRAMLDGRIDPLYCRTDPQRDAHRGEWQSKISDGITSYKPSIGYVYLAGSWYDNWDVPNEALPDDFKGAPKITSTGHGISYSGNTVWMADFAQCTGGEKKARAKPFNWKITSHPAQLVQTASSEDVPARSDYRLPDGANVLFEDGRVIFRSFDRLRPRLVRMGYGVYYW